VKTAEDHKVNPRLVIVSSGMHYWCKLSEKDLGYDNMVKTLGSKEYSTSAYVYLISNV
jgi:hypothetical protein